MALHHLRRGSLVVAASFALAVGVCSAAPSGVALLEVLRTQLVAARSLAPGSRPEYPDVELSSLVGLSRAKVHSILGKPTYCEPEEQPSCSKAASWHYAWGPSADSPRELPDGSVIVTTGGPWLLIIDFVRDRISAVRWQGQR